MSMTAHAPPSGAMTFQEFIAAADEHLRSEWVNGEMVWLEPEPRVHWQISSFVAIAISGFVSRTGLGGDTIYGAVPMRLGSNAREPDVMYLRPENAHRWREYHVEGPADLVVEVIGVSSEARDCVEKFAEYQQAGVREYWLIDPMQKTAEVYRLGEGGEYEIVPAGEPARLGSEVVPGFWIDPAWLWADSPDEWVAYREWGLI
jgi:Uma2 family endonuclease